MNMFKKNGGFTLVELIVVIAILAILAGVAVPAYSGYIKKANAAADITALSAVKTAAQAAYAETGKVTKITFTEGAATTDAALVVEVDDKAAAAVSTTDFAMYYGAEIKDLTLDTGSAAVWEGSDWEIE